MRAVAALRYGGPEVLQLVEARKPEPRPNEVLIRVRAATVTAGDCEVRGMTVAPWVRPMLRLALGVLRPRQPILGSEIAGVVEAVGSRVTRFAPGDRVFGSTSFTMGAYADYACLAERAPITIIPEELTFAEAAGIATGGLNGLHFIRKCEVKPGDHVLVNGAGGSIGMFAVQLAKLEGAEVTAVDRGDKLDFLRELGADHVIDYELEDFGEHFERYDDVIDVVGTTSFRGAINALKQGGHYILGNPQLKQMLLGVFANGGRRPGDRHVRFQFAGESTDDLVALARRIADAEIAMHIDRTYPLEEVADAHAYVEAGNKKGVVVIDVDRAHETR